jgi:cysteine desulfurase/selenocysteine lyase
MLYGVHGQNRLAAMSEVGIIGRGDNPQHEVLVSIIIEVLSAEKIVRARNSRGIRTNALKADHYSGNILKPLGLNGCVRVSMCHYNTEQEVVQYYNAVECMIKK